MVGLIHQNDAFPSGSSGGGLAFAALLPAVSQLPRAGRRQPQPRPRLLVWPPPHGLVFTPLLGRQLRVLAAADTSFSALFPWGSSPSRWYLGVLQAQFGSLSRGSAWKNAIRIESPTSQGYQTRAWTPWRRRSATEVAPGRQGNSYE
jgi:hypothetical protein